MYSSCHIQSKSHSSRHFSTSTRQSGCCSFQLVTVTQFYLQAISSYFLDFSFGNFHGDSISGIKYLLLTHSNACTTPDKHGTNTPVTLCAIQNKHILINFNNRIQQNPSNLFHMFCSSRPSSMCFFRPSLHKRLWKSLFGADN
jgi:hypothetical protein